MTQRYRIFGEDTDIDAREQEHFNIHLCQRFVMEAGHLPFSQTLFQTSVAWTVNTSTISY